MTVQYKIVRDLDFDPVPKYAHEGDAGADLFAAEQVQIGPGERAVVPTGIAVAIPYGFEGRVQPRSGLALKQGVTVVNTPGCVDAPYRGEVGVLLINHGDKVFTAYRGDRIAQFIISPVVRAEFERVDELSDSVRGNGGWGSTGV